VAFERLCSWLYTTLPWLRKLIGFEILVIVGKQAFVNSSQMIFKEVDDVEKPAKVDILFVLATKDWLPSRGVVCLVLREVEMRHLVHIAEARVQGDRGQAKLDGIDKTTVHTCGNDLAHVPELVHGMVEVGVQDRF
jgi:hypothetical protein